MNNHPLNTEAALCPTSHQDLAEVIKDLYASGTPFSPCGLNTRVNWGPRLTCSPKILSLSKLTGIIHHSIKDLTITVESGLPLADLQKSLATHGQWLPVDWPWGSQPSFTSSSAGTIGGLIARGLSGSLRHRYMGVRDQIIGIGIIRTNGLSAHAGGRVVKNVAGYDLMRLLCGSWGSLAVITEITLRTQIIKNEHALLVLEGKPESLEECRQEILKSTLTPEYLDLEKKASKQWNIQIGMASINKRAINDQINKIISIAKKCHLEAIIQQWNGPITNLEYPKMSSIKDYWLIRVAIPPARIKHLINSNEMNDLKDWEWRIASGIGVGDGWKKIAQDSNQMCSSVKAFRSLVSNLGGQVTVLSKPDENIIDLPSWLDAKSANMINRVKNQFDPKNQLSPGRLPGVLSN